MNDVSAYDDPPPDAHQLGRENRELRRKQSLWVAGLASWTVATVIWCTWTTPLGISNATDADWSFGNLATAVLLGAFAYGMLFGMVFFYEEDTTTWKLIAAGAVIPVLLVVVGFALRPKHLVESRSLTGFTVYTGHFPRNALGDAYVGDTYKSIGWVCAKQIRTRDTHFCTVVWTGEQYPRNFHIAGGYRFREAEQDIENTGLPINKFDCFGTEQDTCD